MKIGVITGASSGMGRCFAKELDKKGLDCLWLIARREGRLAELSEELKTPVKIMPLDLLKKESFERYADELSRHKPTVSYLVNCAGFGKMGSVEEVGIKSTCDMIDLNVKALAVMTQATVPFMEKGGHIIELCSSSAFYPLPFFDCYASTKAFVQHDSYALALELKPKKISVTQVSPGWVATEFFDHTDEQNTEHAPKRYKPLYLPKDVVKRAVEDADRGKKFSVYGGFVKLHKFGGRFFPRWFMNAQWKSRLK